MTDTVERTTDKGDTHDPADELRAYVARTLTHGRTILARLTEGTDR